MAYAYFQPLKGKTCCDGEQAYVMGSYPRGQWRRHVTFCRACFLTYSGWLASRAGVVPLRGGIWDPNAWEGWKSRSGYSMPDWFWLHEPANSPARIPSMAEPLEPSVVAAIDAYLGALERYFPMLDDTEPTIYLSSGGGAQVGGSVFGYRAQEYGEIDYPHREPRDYPYRRPAREGDPNYIWDDRRSD